MDTFLIYCHCHTWTDIPKVAEDKLWGLFTYDTVFTVVVTLFVFIAGILANILAKYIDRLNTKKELRQYFKHFVDRVTDRTCPELISMYRDVYQKHGLNEGIPTAPPKILTSDFVRIGSMQDKDLFHAFADKESLSIILSNLDYIELLINEIDSFHKRIRKESDDLRKPLTEKVNKYFDKLADYIGHMERDNPQYECREEFIKMCNDALVLNFREKGFGRQFTKVYKTIIRPIQEMVVNTKIYQLDSHASEIAVLGKDISIQFNYLKRMTVVFRLDYRKFSRSVKEAQDRLVESRQKINW